MGAMEEVAKNIVLNEIAKHDLPKNIVDEGVKCAMAMMSHPCYNNSSYPWSLDDFELDRRLGRGKFGRVFLAREKRTGFLVAMKTLSKQEIVKDKVEKQVMREIEIQSHLRHPNILQLLCWFHDEHRIYLALEYAGQGELYGHLKGSPGGHFDEHRSAKYIYQVADALHYCHQSQVIHRDIKPENLLLTISGDVKVADFGWSVHSKNMSRNTLCGTLDYLPPEMVDHQKYGTYGIHVDHWCLGVLLYEFLIGKPPFESENSSETYRKIRNIELVFPNTFPIGAKDLVSKLLVVKCDKRMTLPKVMNHPWIVANK